MEYDDFLARCLCLDLETTPDGSVLSLGATRGERTLLRRGDFRLQHALRDLAALARDSDLLLGHNLLGHDLPVLEAIAPDSPLLKLPVVDTLYLSPLAFPENPYHRLVKDYKLVRDALNDPVADARLAASLFRDQWESLAALAGNESGLLSFYHYAFGDMAPFRGLQRALEAMGAVPVKANRAFDLFREYSRDRACSTAIPKAAVTCLPDPERRASLAYALAWLRVAGGSSVLPPWVRHRFADVAPLLRQLRDIPCGRPDCSYCREVHDPKRQLERFFGFPEFRAEPATTEGGSLQETIVRHAMSDRPLFAVLPTGGGKSLCYQLPALVRFLRRGVLTIVISPLQALMKDQVDNLRNKSGAPNAAALNGLLTAPERGEVLRAVQMGDVAILYVSPEQLRNRSFREAIGHREVGCWVFDEAHCLSKWGHDFRPDYLYAARFIKEFAARQNALLPPVQCFTATAKQDVKDEIIDHFRSHLGQELTPFEGGVERRNLHFEVQTGSRAEKYPRLHAILSERLPADSSGSAIVYCATRKAVETCAEYLERQEWAVAAFHAGLDPALKRRIQEDFIAGTTRVICATNAFGMGIDKEDVRLVIHADIPGSLENYLQEAGRAGRDRLDAECILLYDEQDIETQFRFTSLSQLSQRDIARILRALRRFKRDREGNVVATTGELLRDVAVETSLDPEDRNGGTQIVTAVAWLERAGFLERNENRTQVFQGRPLVKNLAEARAKIAGLGLSARQQQRWLAILETLMNADSDEGFSADQLALSSAFDRDAEAPESDRENETAAQRVVRTLHDMAGAGLIRKSLLMSAYVRHKVANHSGLLLEKVCQLERALIETLREEAPDAAGGEAQILSLRQLNQHLLDAGFEQSNPEILRNLLYSLAQDGQGLAGSRGSLTFRYAGQDHYRVKLQRDWPALRGTSERRQAVAQKVLESILARIPESTPAGADILVEFAAEDLLAALKSDLVLASQIKDDLAAVDRALMFLHEQRVITLQKGLAVFRQAMTIRILPEAKGRGYRKGDYQPLSQHYGERIFQVHVMNEYARKGLEKIGQALAFVVAYFSQDKTEFVKNYFSDRREILQRATSGESFQRIVDDLKNPVQIAVTSAGEDDNMLILAGPGSGKSRVVVHRCAYLLRVKQVRPRSILVLCFNRNAVTELRRRLRHLVGDEAAGVTIQTYHGLALRLTGHALSTRAATDRDGARFDRIIEEAVALLCGEKTILGMEPDEGRDRLLAGYRHILVDEYQDIDEPQYRLVSAITGRSLEDESSKLSILAVGDDDQNIYQFRGANVRFIRRFRDDYGAETHYLVENYRSSAHIIQAANRLIIQNRDRMKREHPIRINAGRKNLPAGGRWSQLDPLGQGRIQIIESDDEIGQARAAVAELMRLRRLDNSLDLTGCAVLAREWSRLGPVRAFLEEHAIRFTLSLPSKQQPPTRIRENLLFLERLKEEQHSLKTASELIDLCYAVFPESDDNPWIRQLKNLLENWREETADGELPVRDAIEYLYESFSEIRRERRLGEGVFMGTAHAVKGLEFEHVFLLDGGWERARSQAQKEEERRLYYVAMTRARETLCLLQRRDTANPFLADLDGDFLLRRKAPPCEETDGTTADLLHDYAILGLDDIHIGYPARFPALHPIHRALAALVPGSKLHLIRQESALFLTDGVVPLAKLSKNGCRRWQNHLDRIEAATVVAMIRRFREDSEEKYRSACRLAAWEVPMVELRLRRRDIDSPRSTRSKKEEVQLAGDCR